MKKYKVLLYCFIISFIILFFTSKSSFLYSFNDWFDANCFLTVGKSILKGIIPYKDLFEQKGPILYFIFSLASIISRTSFTGVFLLEVLFISFTMYFTFLVMKMFLNEKISLTLLPLFLMLLTTSKAFTHGASCEEFMLLFIVIGLYYFLKHFKIQELRNYEFFIIGLCAGIILLMKYTSLLFFLGIQLIIFYSYIKEKKYCKAFLSCFLFLLGIILPFSIVLIYFGINDAISDFFHVYFVVNLTSYSDKVSIFKRCYLLFVKFFETLWSNNKLVFLLVIAYPFFIWKLKIKKNLKGYLIILFLLTIIGSFYGLKTFDYYVLPVVFFILFSFVYLGYLLKNTCYKLFLVSLIISLIGSIVISPNRSFRSVQKEDFDIEKKSFQILIFLNF